MSVKKCVVRELSAKVRALCLEYINEYFVRIIFYILCISIFVLIFFNKSKFILN